MTSAGSLRAVMRGGFREVFFVPGGSKNGHVFLMVEHLLGLLKGDGCGGGSDRLDRS